MCSSLLCHDGGQALNCVRRNAPIIIIVGEYQIRNMRMGEAGAELCKECECRQY